MLELSGEAVVPPQLSDIIEGEALELRAATNALQHCQEFSSIYNIEMLLNSARDELKKLSCPIRKRYLFSYIHQIEKVLGQLRNERSAKYDA